jgi:RNA polymerase sigma-70 factor, ECF subfamily
VAVGDVTQLLYRVRGGDHGAHTELMGLVYQELRALAGRYMRREDVGHTLQPTALVHEAFIRLIEIKEVEWQDRAHFFAMAAQLMRRVLVDHAREQKAAKRGGGQQVYQLEEAFVLAEGRSDQLLELDELLDRLKILDLRKAKIVEMRFFGGLTEDEIAEVLGVSARTIKREWAFSRAWLLAEMSK